MQLNDIRFFITHANEGKQIYDMLTNLLLHSFVKTANNCCKSFLLTTAWTPYFLGEKRHKRLAWWHFLCCDLQSKLQPRQVAYSNKIANDSGKKKPKTFWKRSERGRRDAYVLEKSLAPIMHVFLTTNSFIFDRQLIISSELFFSNESQLQVLFNQSQCSGAGFKKRSTTIAFCKEIE